MARLANWLSLTNANKQIIPMTFTSTPFKEKVHEVIFEADTKAGKWFDIILLVLIVASVLVVALETVQPLAADYGTLFLWLEWIFTIFFTIEYGLRIYAVRNPSKYIFSFYGIVDLLAILPLYLSLFFVASKHLIIIRVMRLLRVFRIFKLGSFLEHGNVIVNSLKASRAKITVFMYFVLLAVIVFGAVMYMVEGGSNSDFDSIPRSIYWAIVTLTTVGYGDISPITPLGQFIAACIMILGYAVIAVPTGIISAEMVNNMKGENSEISTQACRFCGHDGHDYDAVYCKFCGEKIHAD